MMVTEEERARRGWVGRAYLFLIFIINYAFLRRSDALANALAWANVDSTSKLYLAIIKYINQMKQRGERPRPPSQTTPGKD